MLRLATALFFATLTVSVSASDLRRSTTPMDCNERFASIAVDLVPSGGWRAPHFEIKTGTLVINDFQPSDRVNQFRQIDGLFGTPDHVRYMSLGTKDPVRLKSMAAAWVQEGIDEPLNPMRRSFTMAIRGPDGNIVGLVNLAVNRNTQIADFGFVISPGATGKGYGTEVAAAVTKAAFDSLGVNAVVADVHVENEASQHVMKKVGFRQTGETKSNANVDGEMKTFEKWLMTREDYNRLNAAAANGPFKVVQTNLQPAQFSGK